MNKILTTLALAGLAGASFAHAEIDGLSVKAKVDFESEYIFRGKEHSDENVQTKVVAEYALPTSGVNASIYAGAFLMSPLTQAANASALTLGAKTEVEKFLIDGGYTYYGQPNRKSSGGTGIGGAAGGQFNGIPGYSDNSEGNNNPIYSDSNEFFIGTAYAGMKDICTPSLYLNYNVDLKQLTTEAAVRRSFKGDEIGIAGAELILAGFVGYVDAQQYNGDQLSPGVSQWENAYGYIGGSVDVAYNITNSAKVGTGLRYTWNTDGDGNDEIRLTGNSDTNFYYGIWAEFRY
jgi:hypothetical protein